MATELRFTSPSDALASAEHWHYIGTPAALAALGQSGSPSLPAALLPVWPHLLEGLSPGDAAATHGTVLLLPATSVEGPGRTEPEAPARAVRVHVIALPSHASRHNAPSRADALLAATRGRFARGTHAAILAPEPSPPEGLEAWLTATSLALARACPLYSRRAAPRRAGPSGVAPPAPSDRVRSPTTPPALLITAADLDLTAIRPRLEALTDATRLACRLVDTPPNELGVDAFVRACEEVAAACGPVVGPDGPRSSGVQLRVLRMAELAEGGFGGLVAVGKCALEEPALVHLRWDPPEGEARDEPVAWVGKGLVFDTGGLSLKGKTDMPGMKMDMGGAAAVLAAFSAACRLRYPRRIDAILCLAENAIGPAALRPDDVITLHGGKTVEVNNTDAEGRLVLADGVSFATRELGATLVCDLATLTGAQLIATGKVLGAIVSNDEGLEMAARQAGRAIGEPVFPLPFAPELFRGEFQSPVADLRNSVKDRANAQSSCAAQFIAENMDLGKVRWLHVDLAGPAWRADRGTGFGTGLLLHLFRPGEQLPRP
jgi:probable aminopeptidase NPEPL1